MFPLPPFFIPFLSLKIICELITFLKVFPPSFARSYQLLLFILINEYYFKITNALSALQVL